MITRNTIHAAPDLLFANFNQDGTCISTGTRRGCSVMNCDPFGKVYSKSEGGTSIVEMLFCTSLVALVGAGERPSPSTRRLQIVNTKRASTICELTYPTSILGVKLNRKRLVVVLETQIYVYDIANMKLLHTVDTSPNPRAICALAPSSDNSYLVYPASVPVAGTGAALSAAQSSTSSPLFAGLPPPQSSAPSGSVVILDALSMSVMNVIHAHRSPIACIAVDPAGSLLATASDKGTVARVYSIPDGDKLYEFRRGSYHARIFSMAFSPDSRFLGVSSDSDTVHIFKLDPQRRTPDLASLSVQAQGQAQPSPQSRAASWSSVTTSVSKYLPGTLTSLVDSRRDFAHLKLPVPGVRTVLAITHTHVLVVTSDGMFYSYLFDAENGGECILQKSYSILDD